MAIKTALTLTPKPKEFRRFFIVAPSLVLTRKIPKIESIIPTPAISIGAITALIAWSG
ncbi:MAG: hypothetical protein BWY70_01547 [Bacteroidetes bacterium ADurb.Bin408]|nr:MAG: hypothetical protein BWY70_01547 [Bacteroidetes bacterium ADurb.Bin408]